MKTDCVIIVDIEATCWESDRVRPAGQESEIIEIGVCPLDLRTGQPLQAESILTRPERSRVSPFCERLTTLTQEMVDGGVSFAQACALLRERWQTQDRPWASYGAYDIKMFQGQCARQNIEYPFSPIHYNAKTGASEALGLHRRVGMAEALKIAGLRLEGTHHRGGDDARNIARLLAELRRRGCAGWMRRFRKAEG
jgi:inhibitor of KinA sporulation pathway (predicted exonuclease)